MADDDSPLGGPLELPESGGARGHQPTSRRRSRWLKKLLIGIIALLILAGIGFGAGKLLSKRDNSAGSNNKTTTPTNQSTSNNHNDVSQVSGTKTFTSSSMGLSLTYPDSWSVNENDGVRLESPSFTYQTVNKGAVTGNFRLYIRQGARDVDSKYIGRGVATQDSEEITYANPTSTQRKTTVLSFFGLDTADQFAYFLVAGNFNLKKGDTLGPNYGKEASTFIVMGGYSSHDLTDDFATNQVPLNYFQTTNAYKQAVDIIKSLKLQ